MKIKEPIVYFKSSEHMVELEDNSVQLIITSPPYGKIKDYGIDDQIGFSDSFEAYFERLNQVWKECYRVLEPQCRMVINIGDQYLRTTEFGRYRILSIASQIIRDCLSIGFDFLGDIIWQKVSTTNTTGGCSFMGSIFYPRNGLLTYDYEHILIFKKHLGKATRHIDLETKELSKISLSEWKKWFSGHWKIPGVVQKEHIAMFPEEIPYRIIRMFSFIGDTILDPFVGSGTSLKVAKCLLRNSIGYEINLEFQDIIEDKIKQASMGYFLDFQFLLYKIYENAQNTGFMFNFNAQKQKSLVILKDRTGIEILLDYLLIDENNLLPDDLTNELKIKFEENTIKNYLNEMPKWESFHNYIIIVNFVYPPMNNFKQIIEEYVKSFNFKKPISIFYMKDVISKQFSLKEFFN
ncbi:MAG: DNA methyltransferase [Candidatus Hermodarchaeota archaeon]